MSVVSPPSDSGPVYATRPHRWVRSAVVADGRVTLTGAGSLSGTVRVASVPAARVVEVYDEVTLQLAASTTSAGDGSWLISGLTTTRPLRYIVRGTGGERDVTIRGLYAT
jgi:hypothetical protein